jgi:hypothetical protein
VNESCSPSGTLSGGHLQSFSTTINPNGSFSISVTLNGTVGGQPFMDTITINGKLIGSTASGTFVVASSFNYQGADFSCSLGTQTWTATRS